jgi:hypothetical protein
MSQIITTAFTKYEQTTQEQLSGMSLGIDQTQFIQTQLATMAEERLALVPDPNNYAAFIQQEAALKGQMQFAQYLLDCSLESQQQLVALAEAQAATS